MISPKTTIEAFAACEDHEALLISGRHTGKSDAILEDFLKDVGQGYGSDWQGIFINGTWDHVTDYVAARPWMGAEVSIIQRTITWPGGEVLRYAQMANEQDMYSFYGYAFPWVGWDDLNCVTEEKIYDLMEVVCRSVQQSATCSPRFRATLSEEYLSQPETQWIKDRFGI